MATYDAQIKINVKNLNQLTKLEERVNRVQNALQGKSPTGKQAKSNIVATSPELQTQKLITKELKKQEKIHKRMKGTSSGGAGGMNKGGRGNRAALTSAAISGAFPLLFGQGLVGGAAGFAGGFIGTKMGGQMGGFAGGLVATAALKLIQDTASAISQLGQALGPFTQNTEAVVTSLGLQNSVQQAQIKLIEQVEGKTAAFNAAMKLMANDIGQRGVDALKQFGESSRILSSQFTLAITKLQAFAAGVANFVLRITGLENRLKKADAGRVVGAAAVRGNSQALGLIQRQKQIDEMDTRGGE